MVPVSFTSGTFPPANSTISTGTYSSANNDMTYIKYCIALAGLNKLETQSMNLDTAELANVLCTIFN